MLDRRVVITGLGVVSSLGCELPAFWSALCNGCSGIRPIQSMDTTPFVSSLGGEVQGFDVFEWIPPERAVTMSSATQFLVSATVLALSNAGLHRPYPPQVGVCVATVLSGTTPWLNAGGSFAQQFPWVGTLGTGDDVEEISRDVAHALGSAGVCETHTNGCSATVGAIVRGVDLIRSHETDVVVAGGVDTPFLPEIFQLLDADALLAPDDRGRVSALPRPFDRTRCGMVVGEGAGCVVLEEYTRAVDRGARIYTEIVGWGSTFDPSSLGRLVGSEQAQAEAMANAIGRAGWGPDEVDYVNAAGFGLADTDAAEARAVWRVAGSAAPQLVVSSLTGALGHAFGASGAFQVIGTALAISDEQIPPTLNHYVPDADCALTLASISSRRHTIRKALVNTFGFGGNHVAVALARVSSMV